eukprot:scaffold4518_cov410-Prasinococcus_capsulatus_cf.AAC.16
MSAWKEMSILYNFVGVEWTVSTPPMVFVVGSGDKDGSNYWLLPGILLSVAHRRPVEYLRGFPKATKECVKTTGAA